METNKENQVDPKAVKPDASTPAKAAVTPAKTAAKPKATPAKTTAAKTAVKVVPNPAIPLEAKPAKTASTLVKDAPGKESAEDGNNHSVNLGASDAALEMSSSFKGILPKIHSGELVTLKDEEGFYFQFEQGRLKKFADNGSYVDSAPLYTFQEKSGWAVKK